MEKLQDKIIRDRLNSLDTLPEGYTPNLASKWSVLEAGMQNKRRRSAALWKYVAAAAVLLMIGGASLWILRPAKPTGSQTTEIKQMEITSPLKHIEPALPVATIQTSNKKVGIHKQRDVKTEQPAATITVSDTNVITLHREEQVALTPVKVKKPRFAEVDFNDNPIATDQPSEPVMAAQKFRFKVNIGNSVSGTQPEEGLFRLRKTLN